LDSVLRHQDFGTCGSEMMMQRVFLDGKLIEMNEMYGVKGGPGGYESMMTWLLQDGRLTHSTAT
jgi:hypothetical protein